MGILSAAGNLTPRNSLFPSGNQLPDQIFDLLGTFRVAAAQQILNTLSLNKPRVITQIGDMIHAP
jgi:hypothetical protein